MVERPSASRAVARRTKYPPAGSGTCSGTGSAVVVTVPSAGRHLAALRLPGVEAAAFRAAHRVPLDLRERDLDRDPGRRLAGQVRGHDLGLHAGGHAGEVRRAPQPDVPRRGIDADAGAAGDGLARDVGDLAFEPVLVRPPRARVGLEVDGQLAVGVERRLALEDRLRRAEALVGPPRRSSPSARAGTRSATGRGTSKSGCFAYVQRTGRPPSARRRDTGPPPRR